VEHVSCLRPIGRFAPELVDVMDASSELGVAAPVLTLIAQWRNTAEVWADPELLGILRSPHEDGLGPVARRLSNQPAKRGDRVAPPAGPDHWEIKYYNPLLSKGWEEPLPPGSGQHREGVG